MNLTSHTNQSATTRASVQTAYELLADVVSSARHFPDIDDIRPVGDLFLWKMKKVGAGPLSFQSEYHARFEFDPGKHIVRWSSVPGRGNTDVKGSWTIVPQGDGARFTIDLRYVIELPLPALMRSAAERVLAHENGRILAGYLENLRRELDRRAG